ncbi:unnamed protein product [Microthlaspi erraticum]|uniref:Uncharacterized protein n=1 Tax=Microthlaspi erraticum TaxID=1685480 RepID=A0A6D2I553_9BRAS|nr:unnamed protein product [Microthlaspi erraticum]CAA7038990.1 unnamed protein product [Microthlaspi erraticum]
MGELEGWSNNWLEPACLLWQSGGRGYERPPYMTRTDEDEPHYTAEQELAYMQKQVNESDGFDIDYTLNRCVFNYHPAMLDSHMFVDKPKTTEDLLKRLSQKSLDDYNETNKTRFEFVKVVKANFHWATAIMHLITFEVKDPFDDKIKLFQAKVRHAQGVVEEYVFCRPKPNQIVECVGNVKKDVDEDVDKDVEKEDTKKPRSFYVARVRTEDDASPLFYFYLIVCPICDVT